MTLHDILINLSEDKHTSIITIEGNPVWDYKLGKENQDILLISEDPWEGVEEEYVTVAELITFAYDAEVPFEEIKLYTESDYEQLKTNTWLQDTLVLSHY